MCKVDDGGGRVISAANIIFSLQSFGLFVFGLIFLYLYFGVNTFYPVLLSHVCLDTVGMIFRLCVCGRNRTWHDMRTSSLSQSGAASRHLSPFLFLLWRVWQIIVTTTTTTRNINLSLCHLNRLLANSVRCQLSIIKVNGLISSLQCYLFPAQSWSKPQTVVENAAGTMACLGRELSEPLWDLLYSHVPITWCASIISHLLAVWRAADVLCGRLTVRDSCSSQFNNTPDWWPFLFHGKRILTFHDVGLEPRIILPMEYSNNYFILWCIGLINGFFIEAYTAERMQVLLSVTPSR